MSVNMSRPLRLSCCLLSHLYRSFSLTGASKIRPHHPRFFRLSNHIHTRSADFSSSKLRSNTISRYSTKSNIFSTPHHEHTIFALSTAQGKAGVAVFRVSGPKAKDVLRLMTTGLKASPSKTDLVKPRSALYRRIIHPKSKEPLDTGVVVFFQGPNSFTGEDVVELHVHGGTAVIQSVVNALGEIPGFRHAEKGEFIKRAFDNEKLDLTEIEGLADLINAETEAQRKQALRQAGGALKELYDTWRTKLIKNLAHIEAIIDFGEDEQIEDGLLDGVVRNMNDLRGEISTHLNDNRRGEILRNGIHVTILGPPNAGKSSLLNWLAQRQAAIVSPHAGTTRDILELSLNIGGYPVLIGDTAGLRESSDEVEMVGVERAKQRLKNTDLKILMLDSTDITADSFKTQIGQDVLKFIDENTLILLNKADLLDSPGNSSSDLKSDMKSNAIAFISDSLKSSTMLRENLITPNSQFSRLVHLVSIENGYGMDLFLNSLTDQLKQRFDASAETPIISHSRYREHLNSCLDSIDRFLEIASNDADFEADVVLAAEEIRLAAHSLGKITGRVDVEEVLDVVFSEFCIGK